MYNNSQIKWTHGMELTAEVFQHQDADLDRRQQLAVRTAIGEGRIGLLPGCEFSATGSFVDRTYEIARLQCTALLPSGRIISVDDAFTMPIPHLSGEEFFICLGFAEGEVHEFERDGIPYEGAVYELTIHTADEIPGKDLMPLKRMVVKDGMLNIDADYIAPTLTLASDDRILQHVNCCCEKIEALLSDEKIDNGECRRSLLHVLAQMRGITVMSSMERFISLLQEVAFIIDFYFVKQMGSTLESMPEKVTELGADARKTYNQINLALYLDWLVEFIEAEKLILEKYVVEDKSIDLDKLKAEIKAELTDDLMQQLYEKLKADLTEAITTELTQKIEDMIRQRIEELRPELFTQLHDDLRDPLYRDLYDALYAELSKLSYKPQEVVDTFVPLI